MDDRHNATHHRDYHTKIDAFQFKCICARQQNKKPSWQPSMSPSPTGETRLARFALGRARCHENDPRRCMQPSRNTQVDFLLLTDCGQDAGPDENPSSGAYVPDTGNDDKSPASSATANTGRNKTTWPDRHPGGTQRTVHDTRSCAPCPRISTAYARRQSGQRVRDTRMHRMVRPSFVSRSLASSNAFHTCMQCCVPYILSTGFFRRDDAKSGSGHRKGNGVTCHGQQSSRPDIAPASLPILKEGVDVLEDRVESKKYRITDCPPHRGNPSIERLPRFAGTLETFTLT